MYRSRRVGRALAALAVVLTAVSVPAGPASAAVLPSGFSDDLVVPVAGPTALAFTPDGRLLVTQQGGAMRVVQNGALVAGAALDLTPRICATSERGLLGVAVDPLFTSNRFVYTYYTHNLFGACVNRVSRWVLSDGNTAGSEVVLVDRIHSTAGHHNAGDLQFGKDGHLYVSVGDGGCDYAPPGSCHGGNDAARDRHVMLGKILRITRDPGVLPADNPFMAPATSGVCGVTGSTTAGNWCRETFAWGLRNPFRIAFDPNAASTRFYVNDVGQGAWEEIDQGAAGADYGWNVREGHCANGSTTNCGPPPTGMTNPVFDYGRADGCRSITGGAFVPNSIWPSAFDGKYLFSDFGCGRIFRLDPNGSGGFTRTDFVTALGDNSAVHLRFGPWNGTQALYYTTYAGGGQVRRVSYAAQTAVAGATWYPDGTNAKIGLPGGTISAFGVAAFRNLPYTLVLAGAGCATPVAALNPVSRHANTSGFIAMTRGTIPVGTAPGTYTVCFRSDAVGGSSTATSPATLTVV